MRFRSNRSQNPWLNRRDQFRLLRLVGGLAFILIAMKVTAEADFWWWMFPAEQKNPVTAQAGPALDDVRFNVQLDGVRAASGGEFVSERSLPASAIEVVDRTKRGALSQLPAAMFAGVEDDTLNIRNDERDAYLQTLDILRASDDTVLKSAAATDVSFPVLMIETDHYRGRLIRVSGTARRIAPFKLRDSEAERTTEQLFDVWVFTPESGNNPVHLIATGLASDIPVGESVGDGIDIEAVGYVFKRQGYASNGGLHVAPLVLAKTIERRPAPVATPIERFDITPYVVGFVVVALLSIAVFLWRFRSEDRKFEQEHIERLTTASEEELDSLRDIPQESPEEFLAKIQSEQTSEADLPRT
ncbi:hypothetical protein [Stratiformator vulcanicus]|uniref:Uncharacterized protein n=1 Tax=Stratiformator vulcanicus TaxID=2527980 RepID=A0A517R0D7_9PLAN|nr:hypothetical protein [Stratiformator vulcanicus]QDT37366.1 hypothetical protein Pan189_17390 [Stratiformator vulcanicus]